MSGESSSKPDPSVRMDDAEQDTLSESAYSASEVVESSSSPQEAFSSHGGESKKRKLQEDSTALHSRVKRLRSFYNDEYRELFNETVIAIASENNARQTKLPMSQIGASSWSPEEKEVLFCSLAKKGRHAIQGIAADVSSKSESEVYIYLERLQKAAADEQVREAKKKLPKAFDIPATFEISEKCCASLDVAAETLSVLQQKEEKRIEKKQHGSLSLLTPKIARWVKLHLTAGEEGDSEISEKLPAAELLNLETLLALSKRFFMNSSIMENNWRTYTERPGSPTITYTAFSDFHNLARSITKRIVQCSLFFAMSRRRALDASSNYRSGRHVKKADVIAALNVLGMETDAKRLWAGVARKCKLRVYERIKHRQASGKRYSYDEIEAVLISMPSKARGRSRAASRNNVKISISQEKDMPDNVLSDSSDGSKSDGSLAIGDDMSDDLSDSALSCNAIDDKQASQQELREEAQDTYAEALDQRASRADEQRLWELLGEDPAEKMISEDVPLPKMPMAQRKDNEDLADWKSCVNYAREWEVYETPIPTTSFTKNRSLGRRIETAAVLTESETESGIVVDDVSSNARSSRRRSTREKPLSDQFVCDESSSGHQSSGTEEEYFGVGPDDDNASRKPNGDGDSMTYELDEPEEEPQHPRSWQEMSSDTESNERDQTIVDEGHRNSRPSTPIAGNGDIEDSEHSEDSKVDDDTDE